jgi:hypothetical protein
MGVIERYAARSHERWIHDFQRRRLWFYDTGAEKLWQGKLEECILLRDVRVVDPCTGRYEVCAIRRVRSKRWQKLSLRGPY